MIFLLSITEIQVKEHLLLLMLGMIMKVKLVVPVIFL